MLKLLFEALFFILPAYIANSGATLSMSIPGLKKFSTPIDFGRSWDNKRILGDGKTFRGLIFGTLLGTITAALEYFLSKHIDFEYIAEFNSLTLEKFVFTGFLLGLGALLGDLVKSFVKRRIGKKRGKPWVPFDQLDFLIGSLLLASVSLFPGWKVVITLLIITPLSHFLSNLTAYKLGLKSVWW